ncbi:MAG TPA: peptidylprolyl isomerase [Syntrophus sp. (in: bacteria)]|jgi:FKBP-type peptidyl-prolyl cis-trans isomerase 2|nr:peptidylprolyl isomerase [Syntrophus sp. (in: bacteria)]
MSQVKRGSWVKISYTGKLKDGKVFETNIGSDPLEFKVGKGKVIKGFENAVMGMKAGETKTVTIKPADGYGAKDQDMIWIVNSNELPADTLPALETEVAFARTDGSEVDGRITKIEGDLITIDGNHPLAGRNLTFEIKMLDVR